MGLLIKRIVVSSSEEENIANGQQLHGSPMPAMLSSFEVSGIPIRRARFNRCGKKDKLKIMWYVEVFDIPPVTALTTLAEHFNILSQTNQHRVQPCAYRKMPSIGKEAFQKDILPKIKVLLFNLFDHAHPSVRINAVRLYTTCLKRCPHAVVQTALDEIMNEVCVLPNVNGSGTDVELVSD
ncbi:unnamed protein product [Echinostoma caproni]|uniref:Adaptin_N domain-containing protein n=1 Tax=Echinostoma caproni TaxID=27848 RepID=A0A183A8V6_9TREM|nr:unnamed protein product [Echinostoma caproni]